LNVVAAATSAGQTEAATSARPKPSTWPLIDRAFRNKGRRQAQTRTALCPAADDGILDKAYAENWILIANDKDFGEQVCRDKWPPCA